MPAFNPKPSSKRILEYTTLGLMIVFLFPLVANVINAVHEFNLERKAVHLLATVEDIQKDYHLCQKNAQCTTFIAQTIFSFRNTEYPLNLDAGEIPGHHKSSRLATYAIGQHIPIIVNPDHPEEAYVETPTPIWIKPALKILFLFSVIVFLGYLCIHNTL